MKRATVKVRFNAISTEGEALIIKVAIRTPEPDPKSANGDWRCKVKLAGLSDKTFIYGIDSLQALSLAIKYVEAELRAFPDAGWQFYLPDHPNHPIDVGACYFPTI